MHRLQLDHKRFLIPQYICLLMQPVSFSVTEFHIEVKEDAGKHKTHLMIGKAGIVSYEINLIWLSSVLLANAVSRADRERIQGLSTVKTVPILAFREVTLWYKVVRVFKVRRRAMDRVHRRLHDGLRGTSQQSSFDFVEWQPYAARHPSAAH